MIRTCMVAALLATSTGIAQAAYVATGPFTAEVCKGFGIEVCSPHTLAAVKGDDGRRYTIATTYESVSEFRERDGRCWIRTKSAGGGVLSWAINGLTHRPVFFERTTSGEYKELDVEYITFKCEKR